MKFNVFIFHPLQVVGLLLCIIFTGLPKAIAVQSDSGIAIYVLRVIYPESERKGVTLKIGNNSASPYLIQSLFRNVDPVTGDIDLDDKNKPTMPFIVTPPLSRLDAQQELVLRIRRNDVALPDDRESVFFISVKGIPALSAKDDQKDQTSGQVAVAVVNSLKVFYRPEGLAKKAVVNASEKLRFRRDGQRLIAENPTPYWLTFSRLKVGNHALEKAQLRLMVPPRSERAYTLPAGTSGAVEWQLIDEDGWDTPLKKQP